MSVLDEHFRNPRNAGALEDADLHVEVENPVCGDVLHLYLRRDGERRVSQARFQVYGCPAAIAAASLLTEMVQGKSFQELSRLERQEIDSSLGGLSAESAHAAVLAADAVKKVLEEWEREPHAPEGRSDQ